MESADFVADLGHLSKMLQWIKKHLRNTTFSSKDSRKIEIALEEALVNIIHYAYGTHLGNITITFSIEIDGSAEWTLVDQGIPFNPLIQNLAIDKLASLEKRKEGGLGILLIHKFMDELHYQRIGNENILSLKKRML
ncbi:MAG: ATP-binding protein [Simkaniaceae bacterium]|nr:ATP-binding protein [Simkaniaceae bacterium]